MFRKQGRSDALQVDSRKDLEKLLKATCEVFIMAVTKLTVEPMLSFITKVTAVRVASSLNSGKRLREQVSCLRPPSSPSPYTAPGKSSQCFPCWWKLPLGRGTYVTRSTERAVHLLVLRCEDDRRPLPAQRGWRRWR